MNWEDFKNKHRPCPKCGKPMYWTQPVHKDKVNTLVCYKCGKQLPQIYHEIKEE